MTTLSKTSFPQTPSENPDAVRETVSRAYARAIEQQGSCCSPTPAGVAACAVDYSDSIDETNVHAAGQSFGCGNPLAFAGVQSGETVLDLGSGAGLDLLVAAGKVGPDGRVIGVDMTPEMIAVARRNIDASPYENIEVREGVIEELPVDDASVDWVISNCVINLSPDKGAVFREIARVLRPGGRFSISDIVAEDLPETLRTRAASYSACIGGAISEAEYTAGLEAAGLVEVGTTDRLVYDATQLRGLVASDLASLEMEDTELEAAIPAVAGKVASVRFVGRKA